MTACMSAFPPVTEELVKRYDVPAPRYTSYPTAPEWKEDIGPAEYAAALKTAATLGPQAPLSLYVHIPFCKERCTFCGCNVVIARNQHTADKYLAMLAREMDQVAQLLGERNVLSQVHFGGGTPTFLDEEQLTTLWGAITRRFTVAHDAEVAIEVDPVVTTRGQLKLLRSFGFNRVSLGVQDLDPKVQKAIDRIQSEEETRSVLEYARSLGFTGINVDLIYGLPYQTQESWKRTLSQIVAMRPDRAAVYGFAYVPEQRTNQKRLPVAGIPRGAQKLDLFRTAWEAFTSAGYQHIGMDHFALPEDELGKAQSKRRLTRNFQGYTVKAEGDVVAVGASAISDVSGLYAQNARGLPHYYAAIEEGKLATERGFRCSEDDRRRRAVINGIMCNSWVDLGTTRGWERELSRLRALEGEGLVTVRGSEVELTPLGRIFVRNVACVFDAYLEHGERLFSRAV
ncbi:MAG TPA: oxygen-independent coproporphyrinogen III oxidase [Myxococcales bacterium]